MPRNGRACRRGHVVHGARSARRRRHRLLLPSYRGERRWCLAAAHARPLIRSEDILRQAEDLSKVRRDAIQRGALLARPTLDGGATIVAHVIEQSRAPVTDVDARRAGQAADGRRSTTNSASASKVSRSVRPTSPDRFHGRRLTVAVTIRIGPDDGSPSGSPTPSTSRRTERRRCG